MRARRTAAIAVAVSCACAGGPALAAVAGRSPDASPRVTGTLPIATATSTSTLTTSTATGSSTTATQTTTTATTTAPKTAPVPKLSVCLRSARNVVATSLHVRVSAVRKRQRVGSNGMPQCNYLVQRAHGSSGPHTRAAVVVNVDNGAQAGWRLMRKVVEASQIFGPVPKGFKAPIGLNGLGPYASWFTNLDQLMVNNVNRHYILTVSIIWSRANTRSMIALARAVVVPYRQIRRFHP